MNTPKPVALVTGASSGIGEVFARKLSARGYRLILAARRKDRLEKLASELPNAETISVDLTNASDLRSLEAHISTLPRLDFLVNNAGFGVQGAFFEADLEALDRMHRLHIIAIERLTHAALHSMTARSSGNIINVSSVAGFFSNPFSVSYCSTKAWINNFTEGIYLELKSLDSPVRIQALCPGFTHTEFHDVIGMDRNKIPSFLWMSADDVVDASLCGLDRNRLFVIPGWQYRFFIAIYRWFPRSLSHRLAIRYGRAFNKLRVKNDR
jgi:short-subunit dehydrogenase